MKVLIVGDLHLSHLQPISRLDSYIETCLYDLKEVLRKGKEQKVDAVLFLGDIFDVWKVSPELINRTIEIFQGDDYGEPWPFEVYALMGNHDIDNTLSKYEKSSFYTLIVSGVVKMVNKIDHLSVSCIHWSGTVDADISNGLLKNDDSTIVLAHAYIAVEHNEFVKSTIYFHHLELHEDTKLLVAGHFHYQMHCERPDNKIFINPGSISRRNFKKEDIDRQIQVLLVDYSPEHKSIHSLEYLPLDVLPYDKLFNIDKRDQEKADMKEEKEFHKALTQITIEINKIAESNFDHLDMISKEMSIDDTIVENAKRAMRDYSKKDEKI